MIASPESAGGQRFTKNALNLSPSSKYPRHRRAAADTDKAYERHIRISGECMKHKTSKGSHGGKSKQTLDEISDVQHGLLLGSGRA
jgi:hypothetical protein